MHARRTHTVFRVSLIVGLSLVATGCCSAVSRYMQNAKRAEAMAATAAIGRGIIACAAETKALPPTSTKVPAALSDVSGKKYQSSAADWSSPTWTCAKFSMSEPSYFQYHWELTSPTKGTVKAEGDLTGSGSVDNAVEVDVTCSEPGVCTLGAPREL
jgi:hypothetical protein